jgi:hypothetical protein
MGLAKWTASVLIGGVEGADRPVGERRTGPALPDLTAKFVTLAVDTNVDW